MTKIEKPNFTMTPNVFFDEMMQDMKLAELKVTLTVIRETFGWHRAEHELSISYLVEATGLSNRSVIDGLRQGMERGTIYRKTMGKTNNSGYVYGLAMKKLHSPKVKKLHSESEETSQLGSEETSHNKERDKEKGKESPKHEPVLTNPWDDEDDDAELRDKVFKLINDNYVTAFSGLRGNSNGTELDNKLQPYIAMAEQYGFENLVRAFMTAKADKYRDALKPESVEHFINADGGIETTNKAATAPASIVENTY